jgi:hypothetical protein
MKHAIFTLMLLFCLSLVFAQGNKDKFSNKFDDVIEEDENQNLTLRFFNALTGAPVTGASVILFKTEKFTTDDEGKIRFPVPEEDGFIHVKFEAPKYITSEFKIEVIAGTLLINRFSVSPTLDLKHIRIVLDWDSTPKDLDAHFVKNGGYHISFRNTRVLTDGTGELDRDDMDGFGPETITIKNIDELASYEYYVHDYSNRLDPASSGLSKSLANVKVYAEGRLRYVFTIPIAGKGNTWSVFKLTEGQFIEINRIENR